MKQAKFDTDKAKIFQKRMMNMLNEASLALMTSIGHRTGLFDALQDLGPASIEEIAARSGLNQRYVREWMGAMITGRIVEYNAKTNQCSLPSEHAHCLTQGASPNNMAVYTQYIGMLGGVEDHMVRCFHEGGGIRYSEFPRFSEIMAEDSAQSVVSALLIHILPLVTGLEDQLRAGIDVLDIGCGTGRAIHLLARTFPSSRFSGFDISEEAIEEATEQTRTLGLSNAKFEVRDACVWKDNDRYHLITAFDAIHDQPHADQVLSRIFKALKPGGVFLMQDICASTDVEKNMNLPSAPFQYTISCMHCLTVSLAENGMGLGAMWGRERATRMLEEAGFEDIKLRNLPHDFQNEYYISRKKPSETSNTST